MIIDRKEQGIVRFRLEAAEWRIRNGKAAKDFIHEFKRLVPFEHREFDFGTNFWTVETSYFDGAVEKLRKKYFKKALVA
jgi:hypothetical protein